MQLAVVRDAIFGLVLFGTISFFVNNDHSKDTNRTYLVITVLYGAPFGWLFLTNLGAQSDGEENLKWLWKIWGLNLTLSFSLLMWFYLTDYNGSTWQLVVALILIIISTTLLAIYASRA